MADPFEEFEFKPLTEGLGFHKKNKKEAKASQAHFHASSELSSMEMLENGSLRNIESESPLRPPLPRESKNQKIQYQEPLFDDSSAAVEEILQTLRSKQTETPKAAPSVRTVPPVRYRTSILNISAFFLDAMLVLAATLLCMIVVLSITKVDITGTLFGSEPSAWIYLSTAALFALVAFIYLAVHRIFLGATPGEWAYDQRIGYPEQVGTASYALSVIARAVFVVLTGIIVVPLVSLFIKRDLAGEVTQTQMLERV
jgi:uncharacterized RDD family membrane protein YckC